MSERQPGWYWVWRDDMGWAVSRYEPGRTRVTDGLEDEPAPWVFAGMSFPDETWDEIGQRIPDPDDPWQCVPVEANADMLEIQTLGHHVTASRRWRDTLAAAPKP